MWPSRERIVASRRLTKIHSMKPPATSKAATPKTIDERATMLRTRCRKRLRKARESSLPRRRAVDRTIGTSDPNTMSRRDLAPRRWFRGCYNDAFQQPTIMAWNGVTLFPTFVCNFTCPFCAFSADLNQKKDELTLEEIEKIASSLGRVLVLHIGGGEPFIRKDLPEILEIFRRTNGVRRVEIPTNGWSAERIGAQVRRILEKMPGARLNVRISLDGIGELHDRLRARPGSYKAAVETLEALRGISREEPRL